MGEWGNERLFCLPFSPSPAHPFGAIAPQQADTAPPRRTALQLCAHGSAPRPASSALLLLVPLPHTFQPARQEHATVLPLPPWPERRSGPDVSGQCPPLRVPVSPVRGPAASFPRPGRAQIHAQYTVRCIALLALELSVLLYVINGTRRPGQEHPPGHRGQQALGRG